MPQYNNYKKPEPNWDKIRAEKQDEIRWSVALNNASQLVSSALSKDGLYRWDKGIGDHVKELAEFIYKLEAPQLPKPLEITKPETKYRAQVPAGFKPKAGEVFCDCAKLAKKMVSTGKNKPENAGREYFTCGTRKCNFFAWVEQGDFTADIEGEKSIDYGPNGEMLQ